MSGIRMSGSTTCGRSARMMSTTGTGRRRDGLDIVGHVEDEPEVGSEQWLVVHHRELDHMRSASPSVRCGRLYIRKYTG
jgi:hypothetical protein